MPAEQQNPRGVIAEWARLAGLLAAIGTHRLWIEPEGDGYCASHADHGEARGSTPAEAIEALIGIIGPPERGFPTCACGYCANLGPRDEDYARLGFDEWVIPFDSAPDDMEMIAIPYSWRFCPCCGTELRKREGAATMTEHPEAATARCGARRA